MTPAARYAAAIVVLDRIITGEVAEKALTNWARGNRFAGSGDRAAIRDLVYDVIRAQRSLAVQGGGDDGRALVIGLLRRDGIDPATVFGAGGHAPAALSASEATIPTAAPTDAEAADLPDWLWPLWQRCLGDRAMTLAQVQQHRAAMYLRVNLSRTTRQAVQDDLQAEGITTAPHPQVATALQVCSNPRRVANSAAFLGGLVDVQDASSQMAVAALPLGTGQRVLDYCAGGGGKALAIADRLQDRVWAHDIDTRRMVDIDARATRSGAQITTIETPRLSTAGPFDLVFCDAPCSGSGTWRRTPDAKWRLTQDRLSALNEVQSTVLRESAALTGPKGVLAYATCSVLQPENEDIVTEFLAQHPEWRQTGGLSLVPDAAHDGFFLAVLTRA